LLKCCNNTKPCRGQVCDDDDIAFKEYLDQKLDNNFIQRFMYPIVAPIHFVKKKGRFSPNIWAQQVDHQESISISFQ
jgi:hypothetical protein